MNIDYILKKIYNDVKMKDAWEKFKEKNCSSFDDYRYEEKLDMLLEFRNLYMKIK